MLDCFLFWGHVLQHVKETFSPSALKQKDVLTKFSLLTFRAINASSRYGQTKVYVKHITDGTKTVPPSLVIMRRMFHNENYSVLY